MLGEKKLFGDTRKDGSDNKLCTLIGFSRIHLSLKTFTHNVEISQEKFRLSDHNLGIEMGRKSKPRLPLHEIIMK